MEEEKTLLQQIRDKEQEFSKKVETVKQETEVQIAAAKAAREGTLRDAELKGKNTAEELYRNEMRTNEIEIERMKKSAVTETEAAVLKGEKNLKPVAEKIVSYVTME